MAIYTGGSGSAQKNILTTPQSNFYTLQDSDGALLRVNNHYPIFHGIPSETVTGFKNTNMDLIIGCPKYLGAPGRSADAWVGYEQVKYVGGGTNNYWMTAGGFPQFTADPYSFVKLPILTLTKSSDTTTQATAIWKLRYSKNTGLHVEKHEGGIKKVDDTYEPSFFKDKATPKKLIFLAQAGGGRGSTGKLFSTGRGGGAGAFGAFIVDIEKAVHVKIEVGSAGGYYGGKSYNDSKHIKVYVRYYSKDVLVLTLGGGKGGEGEDNGGTWDKSGTLLWGNFCYPVPRLSYSVDSFFMGAHGRSASAGESQGPLTLYSTYHEINRTASIHNYITLQARSGGAKPGGGASFFADGGNGGGSGYMHGTSGSGGAGGPAGGSAIGGNGGDPIVQVFY